MPSKPSNKDARFRTLVIHFFNRFFDTDTVSDGRNVLLPEPVLRTRLIQAVALLAVVIAIFMYLLLQGDIGGIHFTSVFYSMVVMGLVMTFKWDSLFPDRRDYLILTPLPVSEKRLFGAKAVALCLFLLPFLVAINIVPTLLVLGRGPSVVIGHIFAVLGASVFSVFFFAGLQGILVNVLTPSGFRRMSTSVQMISIAFLLVLFRVMGLVTISVPLLLSVNSGLLDYFPPVWFLGLALFLGRSSTSYQYFNYYGGLEPKMASWAITAIEALVATGLVVALSYVIGYHRHSRKVLESVESETRTPRPWRTAAGNLLHSGLMMNAPQRAVFGFLDTVSSRSSKHRISAALYSGLGLALALFRLVAIVNEPFPFRLSTSGLLEAPAVLSFVIVAGWRATFSIPHELSANWVFQIASGSSAADFRKAIRKWVFTRKVLPVYALLAVFEFASFDTTTAAAHLGFDLVTTAFLTEAFFFGFPKIPFTCDYLRKNLQLVAYAVAYLFAYSNYVSLMASLKGWAVADALHLIYFFAASATLFGGLLIYRAFARAERSKIIYDEPNPSFLQLNLS